MDSSRNVLGFREDLLLMSKTAMPLSLCESPSQYCGVHTVLTSFSWGRAGDPGGGVWALLRQLEYGRQGFKPGYPEPRVHLQPALGPLLEPVMVPQRSETHTNVPSVQPVSGMFLPRGGHPICMEQSPLLLTQRSQLYFILNCVYVCVYRCAREWECPQRSEVSDALEV